MLNLDACILSWALKASKISTGTCTNLASLTWTHSLPHPQLVGVSRCGYPGWYYWQMGKSPDNQITRHWSISGQAIHTFQCVPPISTRWKKVRTSCSSQCWNCLFCTWSQNGGLTIDEFTYLTTMNDEILFKGSWNQQYQLLFHEFCDDTKNIIVSVVVPTLNSW